MNGIAVIVIDEHVLAKDGEMWLVRGERKHDQVGIESANA